MEIKDPVPTIVSLADLQNILADNEREMRKPHLLISRYNHEKATNKDYNGRQLLELMQNADDAGSNHIAIELNTANRRLRIVNSGEPFTMEGFRSLMVPNLSSKIKKQYIGNKGLGFRSVLNWSEEVIIHSANINMRFSREVACKQFDIWYDEASQTAIRSEYGLADHVIPVPVFAVPEINTDSFFPGKTVIDIRYIDGAFEDIEKQLKQLQPEVLLFLNHITTISISGTSSDRVYKAEKAENTVTIADSKWIIYDNKIDGEDPLLPEVYKDPDTNDQEHYSLKIAIQEGLKDCVNQLFSFFPTKIIMNFPAVIHGTFELDSSRNRIIRSDKNTFLVRELLKLMFHVCLQLNTEWERFRFLNYNGQRDVDLAAMEFYNKIDHFLKTEPVLPCVDKHLRRYPVIYIMPQSFTAMIVALGCQGNFPEMLQEVPDDIQNTFRSLFSNYYINKRYPAIIFNTRVEQACVALYKTLKPHTYARWIAEIKKLYDSPSNRMLTVLYDDKGELANNSVSLFTPSSGSKITIPAHVRIEYLHPVLYHDLIGALNFNDANPPRRLKSELANLTDIQSFEPGPVLQKIVSETKTGLNRTKDNDVAKSLVREMIRSLFGYYTGSDKAKNTELRLNGIPVISSAGEIVMSRDTYLSAHYPIGKVRAELLGDLYSPNELIAASEQLGIPQNNDTEPFLVDFLGVNRFVALAYSDNIKFDHAYLDFVFTTTSRPERFRDARIGGTYIRNEQVLKEAIDKGKLSYEQFIAWLCLDQEVREIAGKAADIKVDYALIGQNTGSFPNTLAKPPSYISFQLNRIGGFGEFVLDTDNINYINAISFDQTATCFLKHHISTDLLREVLQLAGAKNEFGDLSLKRISEILRIMPTKDPAGKHARKIYSLCAIRFKEKQEALTDKTGLLLHGTQDNHKRYEPWQNVYYNRKISLPVRITSGKTLLNFPKRGAENNITGFFGVKTFDDIDFVAGAYVADEDATYALSQHLRQIRPFILVERLSSLQKSGEKKEAIRLVKSLDIILCRKLNYTLGGKIREAEPYDFVESAGTRNTWLIRYSGAIANHELVTDFRLSDVISEIWSIAFDLSNITSEISFIFRDEISYTRRRMLQIHGEEEVAEAESHLDISEAERSFWLGILHLAGIILERQDPEDESDFRNEVSRLLGIDRTLMAGIDYSNLLYPDNLDRFQQLFSLLNIEIAMFRAYFNVDMDFYSLHSVRWLKLAANRKPQINSAYWLECNVGSKAQQASFIKGTELIEREIVDPLAQSCREIVLPDYTKLLDEKLHERFEDNWNIHYDYQQTYRQNLGLLRTTNFEVNNLSQSDRSLMYFTLSHEDLVRIGEALRPPKPSAPAENDPFEDDNEVPEVTDLETASPDADRTPPGADGNKKRTSGGGGYGSATDAQKHALGLKAERMALRTLKEKEYQWVSGYSNDPSKNDKAGYDIRYKEGPNEDWIYIEVKWFASGLFRLTDTEFGFAKMNADRYYIYLVTDVGIKKILFKKLINEQGDFKRENDYFSYSVSEYKFKHLQ